MIFCNNKSPSKSSYFDEEIQPWRSDESNMLNLIIQSAQAQLKTAKNPGSSGQTIQSSAPSSARKDRHSFNFYNNLRKYEKKKVEDLFYAKKDVNFIEKNIKEISEDLVFYNQNSPTQSLNTAIQDKFRKNKAVESEFSSTIQPINWSLIINYEQNMNGKKPRHKDIQSFLKFQSQKIQKNQSNKKQIEKREENAEESKIIEGDKYQKLLRLRQGLRKRNLKSAQRPRAQFNNSLNIEDSNEYNSSLISIQRQDHQSLNKTCVRVMPRTSQSFRKTEKYSKIKQQWPFIESLPASTQRKLSEKIQPRLYFTSQRNRTNIPKKLNIQGSKINPK